MSKEVGVIALGVWIIIVPYLGVPGSWRTVLLVLTGIAVGAMGFLLRSETLRRPIQGEDNSRTRYPFVENTLPVDKQTPSPQPQHHEHKEGITSLN